MFLNNAIAVTVIIIRLDEDPAKLSTLKYPVALSETYTDSQL
jgi:hypothetical protein